MLPAASAGGLRVARGSIRRRSGQTDPWTSLPGPTLGTYRPLACCGSALASSVRSPGYYFRIQARRAQRPYLFALLRSRHVGLTHRLLRPREPDSPSSKQRVRWAYLGKQAHNEPSHAPSSTKAASLHPGEPLIPPIALSAAVPAQSQRYRPISLT